MKRWIGKPLGIVALIFGVTSGGCVYTEQTKIIPAVVIPFKGEYRVDPSLRAHPPQTVAVLPFLNKTGKKEAFDIVRQSFHGHFSTLKYTPVPLFKVDQVLRQADLDTPEKVAQTPPQKLREILHTDAIIRGEITNFDRIYAGVYSQVAVGAEVQMIEGKSGKELWWAKDVSRKHARRRVYHTRGADFNRSEHALNMREIELLRSSDDLFRDMVKTIPQPTLAQALRPPNITILVHDGMRRTDRYAIKVGDVLKVAMEGDPRKKGFFPNRRLQKRYSFSGKKSRGPTREAIKSFPEITWKRRLIVGVLSNDQGKSTEWVDVLGAVTIDTTPPDIPGGLRATGRDKAGGFDLVEEYR